MGYQQKQELQLKSKSKPILKFWQQLFAGVILIVSLSACSNTGNKVSGTNKHSIARQWNEILLEAIRNDYARPTVHARNLFHISAAMYDAWAAMTDTAETYLFQKTLHGFDGCNGTPFPTPNKKNSAQKKALSYAAYRILRSRFKDSPDSKDTFELANDLMNELGYDTGVDQQNYSSGSAAALGNYIADCYISYGQTDGANEANDYENEYYNPINDPLNPDDAGNASISDMNRWQPLELELYIDQSGNPVTNTVDFLSPEWGQVLPFALSDSDKASFNRDGFDYQVYYDPGSPPQHSGSLDDEYKWGFALVSVWSSHLDPGDGVMIDISPNNIGNNKDFPTSFVDYPNFYDLLDGGDSSQGYTTNPATGEAYAEQIVPRADYARVLAEFWADGPDSETPPGHWFVILNEVSDHPEFKRRWAGKGEVLSDLEWDVKSYFALGGTMHDSAIAAWGIKGWYDYIRPVSAIRAMAALGQSSDNGQVSYNVAGIPLIDGAIELVETGDALAGTADEHVGKIKLYAWLGPDFIGDEETDTAGVGWILAENWWPYQRPTFVTPPFAGYVSGHSTFSRAAAELLTEMTGDAYFPGGMSGFEIEKNEFLVFEDGPSVDMTLQWATYRDASDQCSLSRIWGGIHPPADDIPGRLIGEEIGKQSFDRTKDYF